MREQHEQQEQQEQHEQHDQREQQESRGVEWLLFVGQRKRRQDGV